MTQHNLTPPKNCAVYLPALSSFYAKVLAGSADARKIEGIPNLQSLNFFDPKDSIYFYPYGLYSAGHAKLDVSKTDDVEPMVQRRDRNAVTIIGDSGGFQIATGVLKLDWSKILSTDGDEIRHKILTWLEHTADWAMTLDVPAFAAEEPFSKKTGLSKFEDTLNITLHNLIYFMEHRTPGKTKFLNVLSGSSAETSKTWYEAVKHYSMPSSVVDMGFDADRTLEGYAFAGINMRDMYCILSRFLDLIEDNLIEGKNWIHFLGIGRTDWGCYLSSIQRALNKFHNPDLQISFDAASPFVATAYGQCYNYNSFTPKRFGFNMDRAIDDRKLHATDLDMPFTSPVMQRLKVSDICVYGDNYAVVDGKVMPGVSKEEVEILVKNGIDAKWVDSDTNKNGKVSRTSWDTLAYLLYMSHNVYNHISAVNETNRLALVETTRYNVSYTNWMRDKKLKDISQFVPNSILYFDNFVNTLFDPATTNPRALLEEYKTMVNTLSFGNKRSDSFNSLFDVAASDQVDENKFADMNDDELNKLEHDVDDNN